jgi:putative endopeptidase
MKRTVGIAVWLAGAAAATAPAVDAASPMYGQWGLDSAGMNTAIKPGRDFFGFANGAWVTQAQIPTDKPAVTLRLEMTDRIEARLRTLLQACAAKASHRPEDLEGKIGAFYRSFMDQPRVDHLAAKPIESELAAVRNAVTHDELAALMGRSKTNYEESLFGISIDVDLRDPSRYSVYLAQAGLGLPDRDYYLQPEFAGQLRAYRTYTARLLHLLKWPKADLMARKVVEFETLIAQQSWTKVQDRDVVATYNPMTVAQLSAFVPDFAWRAFLAQAGLAHLDGVVVGENTAIPKLATTFAATPVDVLQAWQAFHIADNAAPYLSKDFGDAWFDMHEKALSGQQQARPRWKRALTAVSGGDFIASDRFGTFGTMGWGVGQLYTVKYFPPDAKAKIESLVQNLVGAYRSRLEKLDWMGPGTKAEALRKLDTYVIKVGYPEHARDYSALIIIDDDLVGNVARAAAADWTFDVRRLPGAVDRTDWAMTPQTNDAYNGNLRDIVFPAGILQAPIFDPDADPAINYGAAGGVIGHELTHGFDDQGRKIDETGALRDWWSKDDAAKFEARAQALAAQYDAFRPIAADGTVHINGELTLGENIADLGGLTLALDAYRASLGDAPAPVIDGLSGEQRVFLGWAQAWRGKATDDFVKRQLASDPHSPRKFRVNGVVRNIDAWYRAFGVQPGDALYVAPENRVRIW